MDDCDECVCGHIRDEHEAGFLCPCAIEGCDCLDFESADDDEWDGDEDKDDE